MKLLWGGRGIFDVVTVIIEWVWPWWSCHCNYIVGVGLCGAVAMKSGCGLLLKLLRDGCGISEEVTVITVGVASVFN